MCATLVSILTGGVPAPGAARHSLAAMVVPLEL
jgi:hypothetical protein